MPFEFPVDYLAAGVIVGLMLVYCFGVYVFPALSEKKPAAAKTSLSASSSTASSSKAQVSGPKRGEEYINSLGVKYFTEEEIARHNKMDDIWIIVDGKVYDVTSYVDQHTGGEEAITRYAGKDNTVAFKGEQHPLKAREVLDEFYIGRLESKKKN